MARWYNNWNRGGRYYGRRRYYKRNNYSNSNRRANGNMKAAKQQADQSTFTINIPSEINAFNIAGTAYVNEQVPNAQLGVYAMNIFDQLRKSDFFNNYANMYDEFKIEKVKVKLLPTNWTINMNTTKYNYKNLTVYTAWDRTGLTDDQLYIAAGGDVQQLPTPGLSENTYQIGSNDGEQRTVTVEGQQQTVFYMGGVYCTIGNDITTYSSAESRVVNPNTNTSIIRWLSPKTMQERSQWISTGSLKQWYYAYDPNRGRYYSIPLSDIKGYYQEQEFSSTNQIVSIVTGGAGSAGVKGILQNFTSPLSSDNPCSLLEDNGIKFKPTLLIGIFPGDKTVQNTAGQGQRANYVPDNKITFNVETEVVCSFRGLRKSKIVAA